MKWALNETALLSDVVQVPDLVSVQPRLLHQTHWGLSSRRPVQQPASAVCIAIEDYSFIYQ